MINTNIPLSSRIGKVRVIVFASNGSLKKDGANVMGKGIGHVLATLVNTIPKVCGNYIRQSGNHCHSLKFMSFTFINFPTKNNFWDKEDEKLIEQSINELREILKDFKDEEEVAIEYPLQDHSFINMELAKRLEELGDNVCVYLK